MFEWLDTEHAVARLQGLGELVRVQHVRDLVGRQVVWLDEHVAVTVDWVENDGVVGLVVTVVESEFAGFLPCEDPLEPLFFDFEYVSHDACRPFCLAASTRNVIAVVVS